MHEEVEEHKDPKLKDIAYNWVNSSVFLFYLEVFCIIALVVGRLLRVIYTPLQGQTGSSKYRPIPSIHRNTNSIKISKGGREFLFLPPLIVLTMRSISGSSSFGRARPCQGRGGRFEPGLPLSDSPAYGGGFFLKAHPGGGTGRHAGLKILSAEMRVRVRFPSGVLFFLHTIIQRTLKAATVSTMRLFYF